MTDDSADLDIFGNPWAPPKDRRGRKSHARTPEVAERVAVLRATGQSVADVAAAVRLSEPTLRKYYLRELEGATSLAQAQLDAAMWRKAMDGSVAAANYIDRRLNKGAAAIPVAPVASASSEKLGKKATADLDAQTAHEGTSWGGLLQ